LHEAGREIFTYLTVPLQTVYGGGAIVVGANLQLLFWGNFWETATAPSTDDLQQAARTVLASPYLSEVAQYGFSDLTLNPPRIVTAPAPPASFSGDDVSNMILTLIGEGIFPNPESSSRRNLYMVFAPPSSVYSDSDDAGAHTAVSNASFAVDYLWLGWVNYDTLDNLTAAFTHELVEMITDPEPDSGWTTTVPGSENELVDVCVLQRGMCDGVAVSAYYSKRLAACVVPCSPLQRAVSLGVSVAPTGPRELKTGHATASNFCFDGTYGWSLYSQVQTAIVSADVSSYAKPSLAWTVNGVSVGYGVSITGAVDNDTDPLGNLQTLPAESATVECTPSGTILTIRSTFGAGALDLDVVCTVVEDGLAPGYDTQRSDELAVTVAGRERVMDPAYSRALAACSARREAMLHMALKHVRQIFDRGDPLPGWMNRAYKELSESLDAATAIADRLARGSTGDQQASAMQETIAARAG
jgi:hypothetical protein